MADVKICDRCGKTIVATTAQKIGFGAWRYSIFDRSTSKQSYCNFDLCVECGKKLYEFLNGVEFEE